MVLCIVRCAQRERGRVGREREREKPHYAKVFPFRYHLTSLMGWFWIVVHMFLIYFYSSFSSSSASIGSIIKIKKCSWNGDDRSDDLLSMICSYLNNIHIKDSFFFFFLNQSDLWHRQKVHKIEEKISLEMMKGQNDRKIQYV